MRFIYQIIINAIAIKAASYITGLEFTGDWISLLWVAFVLTLANFFLKPILKLLFGPLILLTLGLFTIAINMIILYIVDYFTPELKIANLQILFWTTLLLGFTNFIFSLIYKK